MNNQRSSNRSSRRPANKPHSRYRKHKAPAKSDGPKTKQKEMKSSFSQNKNVSNKQQSRSGRHKSRRGRGGFYTKSRRPNTEELFSKYNQLLEQHILARKKYFEMYYRVDENQREKLEKNYYTTMELVNKCKNSFAPYQTELFNKRYDPYKPDLTYSNNHNLPHRGDYVRRDGPHKSPHLLPSQIDCDFRDDKEETKGNMEDYKKIKP